MGILNTKKDKILNVWVLTDDKPGHSNQTEGLIKALSNYRQIKVTSPSLVTFMKAIRMLFFKLCDKEDARETPDLICGTGHQTHLSLLSYRRCFGGKTVVMMSPSIPFSLFDLCFIPRHDSPNKRDNVIETQGAINRVVPDISSQVANTGLILLGGPSKHYNWDSHKVVIYIQKILIVEPNIQWVIAGSRRTPLATYKEIKEQFQELELVLPDEVSPDWLPHKILETETVWVTSDSISMIYEALTSKAKTGIIELDYKKPTCITKEVDRLLSEGTVVSIKSDKQAAPSTIYEADRCAKILLEKFDL